MVKLRDSGVAKERGGGAVDGRIGGQVNQVPALELPKGDRLRSDDPAAPQRIECRTAPSFIAGSVIMLGPLLVDPLIEVARLTDEPPTLEAGGWEWRSTRFLAPPSFSIVIATFVVQRDVSTDLFVSASFAWWPFGSSKACCFKYFSGVHVV